MFDNTIKFKYSWRPYQDRVLKEADKFLKDGKINIVAAPGSGKTILGLGLARRLGKPVIIFAPNVKIKNQWISKFLASFTDYEQVPDWISTDIYNLKFFNVVTYQALHYAYKKIKCKEKQDYDTDDVIVDTEEQFQVSEEEIKTYDIIKELKSKKITTLILDEAHHLKSEWWKSLNDVVQALGEIKLVALTATPPYDVEPNIWANYVSLCGEIDAEISVPELVKAKNLCPHQDYIYFNYPTESEIEGIKNYDKRLNEIIQDIKNDENFINAVYNHKFIKAPYKCDEEILENPEYYSSMLVFLNNVNKDLSREHVHVLGHNRSIPKFDLSWFEILLKNVLVKDRKIYENYEDVLVSYEERLTRIGAIEKKNISLVDNKSIQKYFVNSLGKLNSIVNIVDIERENLRQDLRMVILTDYIRKEYLTSDDIEIDKIGVLPIFKLITNKRQSLSVAILTGSLFVIPKDETENLHKLCAESELDTDKIKYIDFPINQNYVQVSMPEKMKNSVMNCISKLFQIGEINLIVGTKSLLGEGWDEPCINSLVLATFVGSFMLSNQMRGRAIRVNENPNKTANIWHLVCVCDSLDGNSNIENADLELLKRRFKSFTGVGYDNPNVTSGIERIGNFVSPFSQEKINNYNAFMERTSNDRQKMFNIWQNAVESKSNNMQMTEEIQIADVEPFKSEWLISKSLIVCIIISIILLLILIVGIIPRLLTFLIEVGFVTYVAVKLNKIHKLSNSHETVKAIGEVLLEALVKSKNIKTQMSKIKVKVSDENGVVASWIEGATLQESNVFISNLTEIFSNADSQRYILSTKRRNFTKFYNVPKIFSVNKSTAEFFTSIWMKKIGKVELIYTKNAEGRKELLKARMQNLDFKDKISRKQKMADWT